MGEACKIVMQNLFSYFGVYMLGGLFIISFLFVCISDSGKRKELIYPTLILILVIVNPVMYKLFYMKLLESTYWRLLWIIPVVVFCAYAIVICVKKFSNRLLRYVGFILLLVSVCACGNYMYKNGNFEETTNAYKLPQEVIEVSNILLELEDNPKIVAPKDLYCYIRQYTSDIYLFYGRNGEGFVRMTTGDYDHVKWVNMWVHPSARVVYERTEKYGYNYWVLNKNNGVYEDELYQYYEKVGETEHYCIYKSLENS